MIHVISLGAGVQSSTMALMAAKGEIEPMPKCAVFADTQHEPKKVYDWLEFLKKTLPFPIHIVSKGSLWKAATTIKYAKYKKIPYLETSLPVFLRLPNGRAGMGPRQCTQDFKIRPIEQECKKIVGSKYERIPASEGKLLTLWIGISTDESHRCRENRKKWIQTRWPLLEKKMSREDCIKWLQSNNYPVPPKSSCTFCPFHSDAEWRSLSTEEFNDACQKEKELQQIYSQIPSIVGVPFLHKKRIPLEKVKFLRRDRQEFDESGFNLECEGMCGL